MQTMTKAQFYKLLNKPDQECNGFEIHLKRCWENNNAKSIFSMTGLDFSNMLGEEKLGFGINISKYIGKYEKYRLLNTDTPGTWKYKTTFLDIDY